MGRHGASESLEPKRFDKPANQRSTPKEWGDMILKLDNSQMIHVHPGKINMEPKNHAMEKEHHLPNFYFLGSIFQGGTMVRKFPNPCRKLFPTTKMMKATNKMFFHGLNLKLGEDEAMVKERVVAMPLKGLKSPGTDIYLEPQSHLFIIYKS